LAEDKGERGKPPTGGLIRTEISFRVSPALIFSFGDSSENFLSVIEESVKSFTSKAPNLAESLGSFSNFETIIDQSIFLRSSGNPNGPAFFSISPIPTIPSPNLSIISANFRRSSLESFIFFSGAIGVFFLR
jgi:hypothetical protein